jgi:hypothetical protein
MISRWMLAACALCLAACDPLGLVDRLTDRSTDKERAAREQRATPPTSTTGAHARAATTSGSAVQRAASVRTMPTSPPAPPRPPPPAPPPVDLFRDPTPAISALEARVGGGPVRALELLVYPAMSVLKAQSPRRREHVDEYLWRGGVDDPRPVQLVPKPTQEELEANLFTLDEVDLTKLPTMIADTKARLAFEGGQISHAILKRNLPFSKSVEWHVHMSSERESGFVAYDAKGKLIRVYQ